MSQYYHEYYDDPSGEEPVEDARDREIERLRYAVKRLEEDVERIKAAIRLEEEPE
jgi:hypothetical protein